MQAPMRRPHCRWKSVVRCHLDRLTVPVPGPVLARGASFQALDPTPLSLKRLTATRLDGHRPGAASCRAGRHCLPFSSRRTASRCDTAARGALFASDPALRSTDCKSSRARIARSARRARRRCPCAGPGHRPALYLGACRCPETLYGYCLVMPLPFMSCRFHAP